MIFIPQANARRDILKTAGYVARCSLISRNIAGATFNPVNVHYPGYNETWYDPFNMADGATKLTIVEDGRYAVFLNVTFPDCETSGMRWCGIEVNGTIESYQSNVGDGAAPPFNQGRNSHISCSLVKDLVIGDVLKVVVVHGITGGEAALEIGYRLGLIKLNRFTNPSIASVSHNAGFAITTSPKQFSKFDTTRWHIDPLSRLNIVYDTGAPNNRGEIQANEGGVYVANCTVVYSANLTGNYRGLELAGFSADAATPYTSMWSFIARPQLNQILFFHTAGLYILSGSGNSNNHLRVDLWNTGHTGALNVNKLELQVQYMGGVTSPFST